MCEYRIIPTWTRFMFTQCERTAAAAHNVHAFFLMNYARVCAQRFAISHTPPLPLLLLLLYSSSRTTARRRRSYTAMADGEKLIAKICWPRVRSLLIDVVGCSHTQHNTQSLRTSQPASQQAEPMAYRIYRGEHISTRDTRPRPARSSGVMAAVRCGGGALRQRNERVRFIHKYARVSGCAIVAIIAGPGAECEARARLQSKRNRKIMRAHERSYICALHARGPPDGSNNNIYMAYLCIVESSSAPRRSTGGWLAIVLFIFPSKNSDFS